MNYNPTQKSISPAKVKTAPPSRSPRYSIPLPDDLHQLRRKQSPHGGGGMPDLIAYAPTAPAANVDGSRLSGLLPIAATWAKIPQTDKNGYFLAGCICCLILLSGLICFPRLHLLACMPSDDLPPLSLSAPLLASCSCWPDCGRMLSRRIVPLCSAVLPCSACAVPCRIAARLA